MDICMILFSLKAHLEQGFLNFLSRAPLTLILVIRASLNTKQIVGSVAERVNAPFLP